MKMGKKTNKNDDLTNLRTKAEHNLRSEKIETGLMSEEDILKTVHELHVHQVELEMQNEELRDAQEQLEESRNNYSDLFDFAPVGYFVIDTKGNISQVNLTGASMLGIERSFLIDKPFVLFVCKEDRDAFYIALQRVLQDGEQRRCELEILCKGKGKFYAELLIELKTDFKGNASGCRIAVIDISKRKEAEQQLITYQNQLRQLSTELSLLEERDRRKFAVRAHEDIAQNLSIAKLKLESLLDSSASSEDKCKSDEISRLISLTIENIRSLTFELSSPILYELGFVSAVEWLTENVRKHHGHVTEFHDDGVSKPIAHDIQVLLFHAVRELLTNIVKHAKAKHIRVNIHHFDERIRIEVRDDGVGFDPLKPSHSENDSGGFGLFKIHESLGYAGGRLEIESAVGKGTTAVLEAPLKIGKEKK
jgi:PAS domain S-box-containing protein